MFDDPGKLLLGLSSGMIFGILLQKGQVAKFQVILGQLLLKNYTVFKIMGTAIAVGTIGVNLIVALGMASLHIQTASIGRVVVGGILFGIGLALFGLCPGTGIAASGEGRPDAMVGVAGMLFGAGSYVLLYSRLQPIWETTPDFGRVTLPQITGTSTFIWTAVTILLLSIVLVLLRVSKPEA